MNTDFSKHVHQTLDEIRKSGLYKPERIMTGPQGTHIRTGGRIGILNFCANNYLGFASHPEVQTAARDGISARGYGLASVRFICGTQDLHRDLERRISSFLNMEDAVLFGSCFDANGGLFEALLGPEDAIFSDELNHASIIDGIRLCKARRYRYRNRDAADLERVLKEAEREGVRFKLIATDGVFSMDGLIADLKSICDLAEQYHALVMVDDSHAAGFLGEHGRGTPEFCGVEGRIDLLTGTFGKALGGASGGYVCAGKDIVELLRQRSRPYLFSNTVPPGVAAASLKAIDLAEKADDLRRTLHENTLYFRKGMSGAGFEILPGIHPIVPVMIGDAVTAQKMSERLFRSGVCAVAFFYPVVPRGKARIRVQISAEHTRADLDFAIEAFRCAKEG